MFIGLNLRWRVADITIRRSDFARTNSRTELKSSQPRRPQSSSPLFPAAFIFYFRAATRGRRVTTRLARARRSTTDDQLENQLGN